MPKALGRRKYLRIAFDINDRKVSFSFWVLMEIRQDSFNSLGTEKVEV